MADELEYLNCDHEAARLLPWFVAGALSPQDSARVRTHLQECPLCHADEQREQRLRRFVCNAPSLEHAPQPGLQTLLSRIDELERELPATPHEPPPAAPLPSSIPPSWRPVAIRWLAAAVVIQTIGLGVLGALFWGQGSQLFAPRFSTLSSPAPRNADTPHIRVVFAPTMSVGEMQALLTSIPATLTAEPSAAGIYTLVLRQQQPSIAAVLEQLRTNPKVLFAEPQ